VRIKSEKYTDANGVEMQKDFFGPDKNTVTGVVDAPVPQETDYSESETAEADISGEEIQAQILLNQAEIAAKQAEQDEVLAEILLQQTVKQREYEEVFAAILLNQMKGGEKAV